MRQNIVRKVQRHGNSMVVPIPSQFRKMGFRIGDMVKFRVHEGRLYITPVSGTMKKCPACSGEGVVFA